MPSQFEKYRFTKKTVLSDETFNKIFKDIDLRITALEDIKKDWTGAVEAVTRYGLQRVEEVLRPSWEHINNKKTEADNLVAQIQQKRDNADAIINTSRDDVLQQIQTEKIQALNNIQASRADAITAIQNAKTSALTEIQTAAQNADTVDGYHASLSPAPQVIVPLDADGVLDLSATYVRSSVYTFRRVDLTNATSDYMLQVGEEAYISFSNTTSVPLRIATQSGTYYECHLICSNTGGTSGGTAAPIYLNPNNTTYSNSFVYAALHRTSGGASSDYTTYSAFRCGWSFVSSVFYITNFVQYKNVKGIYDLFGVIVGYPTMVVFSTDWRDTTTPWTSLGTIRFPQLSSGYIIVRRLV
uniref:Uncharacterized protein n=1 Tax=uncultured Aquificia bacterium TaxID=453415 RepID=H5SBV4_9BACT|nr:hypothetical protein HGMM_F07F09C15 [uncultured Aquificae bacterium]